MNCGYVALQVDPLDTLDLKTDSTLLLAKELEDRGYELFAYEVRDVVFENCQLYAKGHVITFNSKKGFTILSAETKQLQQSSLLLFRQDPPFNNKYLTSTYLIELIASSVLIINDPKSIRNVSEKLCILNFIDFIPETIVTSSADKIKNFYQQHNEIVLKPLYGYGGHGVVKLCQSQENVDNIIHVILEKEGCVMAQRYLPSISSWGDKRVLLINGEILGVINRKTRKNDFKASIHHGYAKAELTEQEFIMVRKIADYLKLNNIFLAGMDIIDGYLIEINVTSPTGLTILNELYDMKVEKIIVDKIEYMMKNGEYSNRT